MVFHHKGQRCAGLVWNWVYPCTFGVKSFGKTIRGFGGCVVSEGIVLPVGNEDVAWGEGRTKVWIADEIALVDIENDAFGIEACVWGAVWWNGACAIAGMGGKSGGERAMRAAQCAKTEGDLEAEGATDLSQCASAFQYGNACLARGFNFGMLRRKMGRDDETGSILDAIRTSTECDIGASLCQSIGQNTRAQIRTSHGDACVEKPQRQSARSNAPDSGNIRMRKKIRHRRVRVRDAGYMCGHGCVGVILLCLYLLRWRP